jgi:hypothetical protein
MIMNLPFVSKSRAGRAGVYLAAMVLGLLVLGPAVFGAAPRAEDLGELAGVATQIHLEYTLLKQFGFSYLTAYMFFLSICLGSLFLVLIHHLFDAGWSVPIRRFLEHFAFLLPVMGLLFIPIALLAPQIYPWMQQEPELDHALYVKKVLFNVPMFYLVTVFLFGVWTLLTYKLRYWSLRQDETGAPECTRYMRYWSAGGIFLFAFTLTTAAIFWMKALQHAWFSTMYGVYYFAGSVWVTLATIYLVMLYLKQKGPLKDVLFRRQFHDVGVLLFAFTVFYAYIHFSQYFLIWNAAIPEETFWYVLRERGSWWEMGMLLVFGHFFVPFLLLLRIDTKLSLGVMVPVCVWAWLMHYVDMAFNILPVLHPHGYRVHIFDLLCLALIGGVLYLAFMKYFLAHAPYPVKDPRLKEAVTHHEPPQPSAISVAPENPK